MHVQKLNEYALSNASNTQMSKYISDLKTHVRLLFVLIFLCVCVCGNNEISQYEYICMYDSEKIDRFSVSLIPVMVFMMLKSMMFVMFVVMMILYDRHIFFCGIMYWFVNMNRLVVLNVYRSWHMNWYFH